MRGALRAIWSGLGLVALVTGSGCVDTFEGSKVEVLFRRGVHVPGGQPEMNGDVVYNPGGRPPAGTHYEMHVAVDSEGVRVFHMRNFQIAPIVTMEADCFIEGADTIYPVYDGEEEPRGLHVSQWYDKLLTLYMEDGSISDAEAGVLADAQSRLASVGALHETVRAVVQYPLGFGAPEGKYAQFVADKEALEAALPAREATDPAANGQRFELCQAFFDKYPNYYVGNDRTISIPTAGELIGVVDGQDPRNLGFIGGADFTIDDVQVPTYMTALRINWQFDDPNDSRAALYGGRVPRGYHYMSGTPEFRTRRVINVPPA